MPRPVSGAIADGLPLWDTYEALFFLVTGIFLGLILGFLFPSVWRSFRRRFRRVDKYRADSGRLATQMKLSESVGYPVILHETDPEDPPSDVDLISVFNAARYAFQEKALRDAANFYLQILGSEKVTRVQTNKAMFELAQVYAQSGLTERAVETALELLHRKPAQSDVFKFLLSLCTNPPVFYRIEQILKIYAGPKSVELSREVTHQLSQAALTCLGLGQQQNAVALSKAAVRWSPSALEPKLALIEATSLWSQRASGRPLDQMVIGFFVDFAELLNLVRAQANRSAFFTLPLLRAWSDFFDHHESEIESIIERLAKELLAQLDWNSRQADEFFLSDVGFLVDVFLSSRSAQQSGVRWVPAFCRLLPVARQDSGGQSPIIYRCSSCANLSISFLWRCKSCQSWETFEHWSPGAIRAAGSC